MSAICRCASRARPGASRAMSSRRATASSSWPVRLSRWTSANPASTATSRAAPFGRAGAHPRQQVLQRRDRAGRIAGALLRLREEERDLRGRRDARARRRAAGGSARPCAPRPWRTSRPEQAHARLAPQRRVLFVARQLAVREGEHGVPFGDRLVDLLQVLEDLRQQAVGLDVLRVRAPAPASPRRSRRCRGRARAAPPPAADGRAPAGARARAAPPRWRALRSSGRPGTAISPRPMITISLPGSSLCSRCHVLSARRSSPERDGQRRELLQRAPVSARSGRWRDRTRRRLPRGDRAASAVRSDRPPAGNRRAGGAPAPRASRSPRRSLPELVVQRDHAAPDLDVARRRRQRGARGRERAFEIAQRVAHAARARPIRPGPGARSSSRASSGSVPRLRATVNATVQTARRRSASPGGSSRSSAASVGGDARGVARIAARRAAGARRAARDPASRRRVPGAAAPPAPRRPRRACPRVPARRPGARRSRRVSGSARASSRSSAMVLSCARLVGGVAGARQDRERGVDETAARRRALLELQRVVVAPPARRRRRRRRRARGHGPRAPGTDCGATRSDLVERRGRRLRVTERRQQVGVGGERRVRRLAAARPPRARRARETARAAAPGRRVPPA